MDASPKKFLHYSILKILGKGGMGAVYQAFDTKKQKTVAIKIIRPEVASDKAVQRFFREIMAHAQFDHPNIVKLIDVGSTPISYFTMEYIEGCNLALLAQQNNISFEQAAYYIKKIAEAVHKIHQKGIIHRDIKPGNIIIDKNGEPWLMDFGLVKVSGITSLSQAGDILGTPYYMSPEQADGEKVDIQSDVYSLGATLYETLTGHSPFAEEDYWEVINKILLEHPTLPHIHNPEIPRQLEKICLKCLRKKPKRRYRTAKDLSIALHNFLEPKPSGIKVFHLYTMGVVAVLLAIYLLILLVPKKADMKTFPKKTDANYTKLQKKANSIKTDPLEPYFTKAISFFNDKHYQKANKIYNYILSLDAKNTKAYQQRGKSYFHLGNYQKAIDDCTRAITINLKARKAFYWRGRAHAKLKKNNDAVIDFNTAISLGSKWAFFNRGELYLQTEFFDQAKKDFDKAIKLLPDYHWSYYYRGLLLYKQNEIAKAQKDLEKYIFLAPNKKAAYKKRAQLYYKLGQKKKADSDFFKAMNLDKK